MKKTISIIMSLLLIVVLAACEKAYKVTFDRDNGQALEVISVKKGGKVEKPADPKKSGYKFLYWSVDGERFEFETRTVNKDLLIKALWKEEEGYDYIKDIDYTPLLENTINFELNLYLDELSYEDETGENPGIKVKDVDLTIQFKGTFTDYESSKFGFGLMLETGEVQTNIFGFYAMLLRRITMRQYFFLEDGNVYSSFAGTYVDASDEEKPLYEFFDFLELSILPNLPEDMQGLVQELLPLFTDYKEYVEDAYTLEIYDDLVDKITNGGDLIESLLPRETVEESLHNIEVTENGLSIRLEEEDELIKKLEIDLNVTDGKFESLEGEIQLKDPYHGTITFSLFLDKGEFDLPDKDDYELVEVLKIEALLQRIDNPFLN